MLLLALSAVSLLSCSFVAAQTDAAAPSPPGTRACEFEGEQIRHRGAKYLAGRAHKRGSIYGACEDGHLTCFEDNGIADAPQLKHKAVPCDVHAIRARERKLGVAVQLKEDVWPDGLVWYRINATFSAAERQTIKEAIAVYASTDVKVEFKECEPASLCNNKYVSFEQNEDACYSYVGYVNDGSPQIVNLGDSCFDGSGTAVHEIGHALGLYHEHTHPEREVIILTDADLPVSAANYAKETDAILKPYDRGSIMHYGRSAGLCLPKDQYPLKSFCDVEITTNCVMPVRQHCNTTRSKEIGQRSVLSAGDLNTLKVLYGSKSGNNASSEPVPIPNGPGSDDSDDSNATDAASRSPAPAPLPSPATARPTATPTTPPTTTPVVPSPPATVAPQPKPTTEAPTAAPDVPASPVATSATPAASKSPKQTKAASVPPPYVPGGAHGKGKSHGNWWTGDCAKRNKKAIGAKAAANGDASDSSDAASPGQLRSKVHGATRCHHHKSHHHYHASALAQRTDSNSEPSAYSSSSTLLRGGEN